MNQKTVAIFITLVLLVLALLFVFRLENGKVPAGDEVWATVVLSPEGIADDSVVPDNIAELLATLEEVFQEPFIAERVANHFSLMLPNSSCESEVKTIDLVPGDAANNKIRITMKTSNPLLGAAILDEVLLRVKYEFLSRTSRVGTEQVDLLKLQAKQLSFQKRISEVQQELNTMVAAGSPSTIARSKIDLLKTQLQQLEQSDRLMGEQLSELETLGEGLELESPTLVWTLVQAPTFDQVSHFQLEDYARLQSEHRELLSPLTPGMQDALTMGAGFTVE